MAQEEKHYFFSFSSTLIINPCISVHNDQTVLTKIDQIRSTRRFEEDNILFPSCKSDQGHYCADRASGHHHE